MIAGLLTLAIGLACLHIADTGDHSDGVQATIGLTGIALVLIGLARSLLALVGLA